MRAPTIALTRTARNGYRMYPIASRRLAPLQRCARAGQRVLVDCSVSGRPRLRLEAVLDDLPVERAAADLEQPGRLLLVPRDRVEHPDNMRALGIAKRRQTGRSVGHRHRDTRVQEL